MKYGITYGYWSKDWEGSDYPQKIAGWIFWKSFMDAF